MNSKRVKKSIQRIRKAKDKAWKFYDKWRKSNTHSPALDSEVRVSLKGWRHLTGATGDKKRTSKDVYRRLQLLPHAKEIIEKSTTIQNISTKRDRKYYALEAMVEVKENKVKLPRKVRVIIVEDKKKNRIFYSVMDKKRKRRRKKSKK